MGSENLAYALVQMVHNYGAAVVLGGAFFVLWPVARLEYGRAFGGLTLAAWVTQIVSGGLFGLTSLYYYGETPDLSSVATTALVIKVTAAVLGVWLAGFYLLRGTQWLEADVKRTFQALAVLGTVALTAAAFLRWFS